jgi:hypothetical protein
MVCCPFPGPRSAVVAGVLSAVELFLLALHGQSFWSNQGLGTATQLGLATLIVLWWTVAVWCGYWYLRGVSYLRLHTPTTLTRGIVYCTAALMGTMGHRLPS